MQRTACFRIGYTREVKKMIVGFIITLCIALVLLLTLALCRVSARADRWQENEERRKREQAENQSS